MSNLTVDDIFRTLKQDASATFRSSGYALERKRWVISEETYAEVYGLLRQECDPIKPPPVENAILMTLPIKIDNTVEGLKIESYR